MISTALLDEELPARLKGLDAAHLVTRPLPVGYTVVGQNPRTGAQLQITIEADGSATLTITPPFASLTATSQQNAQLLLNTGGWVAKGAVKVTVSVGKIVIISGSTEVLSDLYRSLRDPKYTAKYNLNLYWYVVAIMALAFSYYNYWFLTGLTQVLWFLKDQGI